MPLLSTLSPCAEEDSCPQAWIPSRFTMHYSPLFPPNGYVVITQTYMLIAWQSKGKLRLQTEVKLLISCLRNRGAVWVIWVGPAQSITRVLTGERKSVGEVRERCDTRHSEVSEV